MAIGVINSTSIVILSPGITISTPSGRVISPVTSVVVIFAVVILGIFIALCDRINFGLLDLIIR